MTVDAALHETTPRASLIVTLETIAAEAGPDGLTLHELMEHLGERAFGALLFALAVPCCIPFLYGVPQVVALPMAALAGQMALGRPEPWLPGALANRRIDRAGLEGMAKGARRFFGWVEALTKPRWFFISGPKAERLVGALLALCCASILVPLPATNTVPGFGVALASFGLMERDGVVTLGGLTLGVSWVLFLVAAAVYAAVFLGGGGAEAVIDMIKGLLGR